jgi:hypothetical protein
MSAMKTKPKLRAGKLGFAVLCTFLLTVTARLEAKVTAQVSDGALRITTTTPSGRIVVFGITSIPRDFHVEFIQWTEIVEDQDGDGSIIWRPGKTDVARRSVWSVTDLTTGETVVLGTEAVPLRALAVSPDNIKADNAGQLRKLAFRGPVIDVLLVRPRDGKAWAGTLRQGVDDEDPDHERTLTSLDRLRSVAGDASPAGPLRNGDQLVVINRRSLEIGTVEVGQR